MIMNLDNIIKDVVMKIVNMKDGESSTIRQLVNEKLSTKEMFEIQKNVIKQLSDKNIILDYSKYDNQVVGLLFDLDFIKKTN